MNLRSTRNRYSYSLPTLEYFLTQIGSKSRLSWLGLDDLSELKPHVFVVLRIHVTPFKCEPKGHSQGVKAI
jgi:hypothetical protein